MNDLFGFFRRNNVVLGRCFVDYVSEIPNWRKKLIRYVTVGACSEGCELSVAEKRKVVQG